MKRLYMHLTAALIVILATSCGKEFLDIKRNVNQVVPAKIYDYQAILDNSMVMNSTASFELSIVGSDEYVLSDQAWAAINMAYYTHVKNGYVWMDNVYEGKDVTDWNWGYQRILYANMALDVDKITPDALNLKEWKNVKGQAYFHRAFTFYQLAQTFCKPYNASTVDQDRGLPLRTDYDVSVNYPRGTLKEVYDLILGDLNNSLELLPDFQINNGRPSKIASYALLARIYREMERWDEALACTEKVLALENELLDYNDYTDKNKYTFDGLNNGLDNKEIIFNCKTSSGFISANGRLPDSWKEDVYSEQGDLRRTVFFKDNDLFFGSYSTVSYFTGLAVDEVLLIRAECYARENNVSKAQDDLNYLRKNRFKKENYHKLTAGTKEELLVLIDLERKRQLYMRGVRWSDIRHQNLKDGKGIRIVRTLNGTKYVLEPNDRKWVWPLPDREN